MTTRSKRARNILTTSEEDPKDGPGNADGIAQTRALDKRLHVRRAGTPRRGQDKDVAVAVSSPGACQQHLGRALVVDVRPAGMP